jgi:hypothetical protein
MWTELATVSLLALAGFFTSSLVRFDQPITAPTLVPMNRTNATLDDLWAGNDTAAIQVGERHLVPNSAIYIAEETKGSKSLRSIFPAPRLLPFVWSVSLKSAHYFGVETVTAARHVLDHFLTV